MTDQRCSNCKYYFLLTRNMCQPDEEGKKCKYWESKELHEQKCINVITDSKVTWQNIDPDDRWQYFGKGP